MATRSLTRNIVHRLLRMQAPPPKQAATQSCLMLWTVDGSVERKFEIAARAGLQAVGFTAHHAAWSGNDIKRIRKLARSWRMRIASLPANPSWRQRNGVAPENLPSLVDTDNHTKILAEVRENLRVARELEAANLVLVSGYGRTGLSQDRQWSALANICGQCAELVEGSDINILIEPVSNRDDARKVFLTTCKKGAKLVRQVNHPRFRLLFNVYHEQIETGNIIETIRDAAPVTAMYRIADAPGRTEPGTGELHFPNIYKAIGESSFRGHVAMDFRIERDPVRTLIRAVDDMRAALLDVKPDE